MKFQFLRKCVAAVLVVGILLAPFQGFAGETSRAVGTGAAGGAAVGGVTAGVQSAVTGGLGGAVSGAATGAIGGAIAGAATSFISQKLGPGWGQIIGGVAGLALTFIMTDFFVMTPLLTVNIDAAQVALEYMVYDAMKSVTDKWDPEPQQTYYRASQKNECNSPVPTGDMQKASPESEKWDFEVQALKNVGIETLNMVNVVDMANGRDQVATSLARLKKDGVEFVLDTDLDHQTDVMIGNLQAKNYQKMATAGIARAELGLATASQAAVDAGAEAATITADASGDEGVQMSAMGAEKGSTNFNGLPGSITSTAMGMRVQAFVNLEMAQRFNLANALQGNTLSIEAARALKKAPLVMNGLPSED